MDVPQGGRENSVRRPVMILHLGRIALQSVEHAGISCHVIKKQGCVKGGVSQSLSGTSVWIWHPGSPKMKPLWGA